MTRRVDYVIGEPCKCLALVGLMALGKQLDGSVLYPRHFWDTRMREYQGLCSFGHSST